MIDNKRLKPNDKQTQLSKTLRHMPAKAVCACAVVALIVLVSIIIPITHHVHQKEKEKMEQLNQEIAQLNRIKEAELEAQESWKKMQAERRRDSIARSIPYTSYEVEEMARSKAPSYTDIQLWKKDDHNWIMLYHRDDAHNKTHHYLRCFDPTDKTFGKEIEVEFGRKDGKDIYNPVKGTGVFKRYSWYRDENQDELIYFDGNGRRTNEWSARDVKHPKLERTTRRTYNYEPWEYEDAEDEYYDNAEDLYFYYGGEY